MSSFRKLALASTIATLTLVAIGGLVRATKSGLGCGTDWPHCGGRVIPIFGSQAVVIEYAHRLAAAAVIVLIGALAVTGMRRFRGRGGLGRPALGALALVLGQAVLGAIVVKLELDAASVVLHLGAAMALVAVLVYLTIRSRVLDGRLTPVADAGVSRRAAIAAGSVLFLLLVGSYVSGREAGLVFPDWPLMNGALVPDLGVDLVAIHFLHRALAAVVGAIVAIALIPIVRRGVDDLQRRLALVAGGLYLAQVGIGAANIWTDLNAGIVTAHLLSGALIWASLLGLTFVARPAIARAAAQEAGARAVPAIEMANR
ncbi:MAG TPA: COX15/CtaA family protein [Actinomycetota bacterium]|jgi:heme A synthase